MKDNTMGQEPRPTNEQALVLPSRSAQLPAHTVYLEPVEAEQPDDVPGLEQILAALRRRWHWLALMGVLGTAVGIGAALREEPSYEAMTTIELRGLPETQGIQLDSAGGAGAPQQLTHEAFVQTQVEVLSSKSLLASVVETIKAQHRDWTYHSASLVGRIRDHLGLSKRNPGVLPWARESVRVRPNSTVVELTVTSPNPEFSAELANTLIQQYLTRRESANWDTTQRNQAWMTRQLEGLRVKLRQAEDALQSYGRSSGAIIEADGPNSGQASLVSLQNELARAQADRIQKQSFYEIAKGSAVDSLPQVMSDSHLSDYKTKLADLRRQLAELRTQFTPEYYKVVQLTAQIAELEASAKAERDSVLQGIKNDFNAAQVREQLLTNAYAQQQGEVLSRTEKVVSYDIQKHEVDSLRSLYEELLRRSQATLVASSALNEAVNVIDQADPPPSSFKPDLKRYAGMGMISFLFLGCLMVVVYDHKHQYLTGPGESVLYLRSPELAVIPDLALMGPGKLDRKWFRRFAFSTHITPAEVRERTWGNWEWSPSSIGSSPAAEAYRNAVASLLGSCRQHGVGRVLMFTSPYKGEGKSTTVANLGIALVESAQRVLLIDADIRKPRLHQIFDVPNSWGLTDLLREQTEVENLPLKSLARPTDIQRLSILTAGPGVASVSELLYSPRFDQLLERLCLEFDLILIDTPPMLAVSDARIIGRRVDAAVLIVRAGKTATDAALFAKQQLEADGTLLLGTILSGWDMKSKPSRGRYLAYPPYQAYDGRWQGNKVS